MRHGDFSNGLAPSVQNLGREFGDTHCPSQGPGARRADPRGTDTTPSWSGLTRPSPANVAWAANRAYSKAYRHDG